MVRFVCQGESRPPLLEPWISREQEERVRDQAELQHGQAIRLQIASMPPDALISIGLDRSEEVPLRLDLVAADLFIHAFTC